MSQTAILKAFLSPYSNVGPGDLDSPNILGNLSFISGDGEYHIKNGYTHVGSAEISFTKLDHEKIVENKIEGLRQEAQAIRAEATAKVTRLEAHIQTLLAIGCDESLVFKIPADESEIPF